MKKLCLLITILNLMHQPFAAHKMILGSYGDGNNLLILNKENQIEWEMPNWKNVTDIQQIPNKKFLVAHTVGISEISPNYKTGIGGKVRSIWKVPPQSELSPNQKIMPNGEIGETHSCQLLADGKILTGASYNGTSYVLEIDFTGKIHKKSDSQNTAKNTTRSETSGKQKTTHI